MIDYVTLATAIVTFFGVVLALWRGHVTHILINSRLDQLFKAEKGMSNAEGRAEGKAEEKANPT